MAETRVPGGRGPRQDKDALVNENEARALRSGTPKYSGWFLSCGDISVDADVATMDVANRVRLYPLNLSPVGYILSKVSVVINTEAVAGFGYIGLYICETDPVISFKLLPSSLAKIDCSVKTAVNVTLPNQVKVEPNARVFLGYVFNDITIAMAGDGNSFNRRVPVLYMDTAATALPLVIQRQKLALSNSDPITFATYKSPEAARIF